MRKAFTWEWPYETFDNATKDGESEEAKAARIAAEKAGNDALDTGDGVSASQMSIVYEITATQHKPEPKN